MAKTCCLKCDACYLENLKECPKCKSPNFFCDPDPQVMYAAVTALVQQIEADHEKERAHKLALIDRLRPQPRFMRRMYVFTVRLVRLLLSPLLSDGERIKRKQ